MKRFEKHNMFGNEPSDAYDWSIREVIPPQVGLPEGRTVGVISWLTEKQADFLAEVLNDTCGWDWDQKHPDWLAEAREIRKEYNRSHPAPWEIKK